MAGPSWNYVLKFIITGTTSPFISYDNLITFVPQGTQESASPPSSYDSQTNASSPTQTQRYPFFRPLHHCIHS